MKKFTVILTVIILIVGTITISYGVQQAYKSEAKLDNAVQTGQGQLVQAGLKLKGSKTKTSSSSSSRRRRTTSTKKKVDDKSSSAVKLKSRYSKWTRPKSLRIKPSGRVMYFTPENWPTVQMSYFFKLFASDLEDVVDELMYYKVYFNKNWKVVALERHINNETGKTVSYHDKTGKILLETDFSYVGKKSEGKMIADTIREYNYNSRHIPSSIVTYKFNAYFGTVNDERLWLTEEQVAANKYGIADLVYERVGKFIYSIEFNDEYGVFDENFQCVPACGTESENEDLYFVKARELCQCSKYKVKESKKEGIAGFGTDEDVDNNKYMTIQQIF